MFDLNDAAPQENDVRVTDADADDDTKWFAGHSDRRYRARPGWVVRRRGENVLLRTPIAADCVCSDNERSAEGLWWSAAWPNLPSKIRHKLIMTARRSDKS